MCGIVGYVGKRSAIEVLLKGLKRLEYRGYDSAGVAYFDQDQRIKIKKSEGKIKNIEGLLGGDDAKKSHCGIGHTRWATHGKPTTQNAHPHRTGKFVLVHNGIIENYISIRDQMIEKGYHPESETDSELYGFLVLEKLKEGKNLFDSVREAFLQLEGQCSVVVMSDDEPGKVIGIRDGSPLVAAVDPEGGGMLASDAQPLLDYTQDITFMENGDLALCTETGVEFFDIKTGKPVVRKSSHLDWSAEKLDKRGFPHYMLKEIYEQPQTIIDTINSVLDRKRADPFPLAEQPGVEILRKAGHITFVACGSSWHASLMGKLWLERWAQLPCDVELASEFRYRKPVLNPATVIVGISQSGETADTLAVIREMKKRKIPTLAICNVRGSTISREADATFYTSAGPEIGVASTKAFMAQMLMTFIWAGFLGLKRKGDHAKRVHKAFNDLVRLPHLLNKELELESPFVVNIRKIAERLQSSKGFFFIGRGYSFPISLEGALKLKEIAYIHAEGYAAGELKHGPIAMIDKDMTVVVLAPDDSWHDKTVSNLQEVKARGAKILGIGHPKDEALKQQCDEWIPLPLEVNEKEPIDRGLYPFLTTPIIQLLSYELALLKGTDIDQPRNLAKSVTVE